MKGRKKILIFNSGPVFPMRGMNLVRVFNQVKGLSKDHDVDLMFLYSNSITKKETIEKISPYCHEVIPVKTISQSILFRGLKRLFLVRLMGRLSYPMDYFNNSNLLSARTIAKIVSQKNYDVVISHYWQSSGFIKWLPKEIYKCVDTHYLVEENITLFNNGAYSHIDNGKMKLLLLKEFEKQNHLFDCADLLIVNSLIQQKIINASESKRLSMVIPNGQELEYFLNYEDKRSADDLNILFYGALSNQFNLKATKRIINGIFPKISEKITGMKLIFMGLDPPEWLQEISKKDSRIEVTGYVDDVRPVMAKSLVALIPLESGSGFRGRTVELLASGVPVVGTHNALDSVGIDHGFNGYIADDDDEIVHIVLTLAKDKHLRHKIASAGKEFARNYYSLDATFGKLSKYFMELE